MCGVSTVFLGGIGAPVDGARRLGLLLFTSSTTFLHPAFVWGGQENAYTSFLKARSVIWRLFFFNRTVLALSGDITTVNCKANFLSMTSRGRIWVQLCRTLSFIT